MAEEKKEEHTEGGGEGFAVIPMKYITPIILVLIVIGTGGKLIAPQLTAEIGPMILDPFSMIMWAYGFIILMTTMFGDKKTGMQIFSSIIPMLVLALIIPMVFGFSGAGLILPVIFMMIAPFLGNMMHAKAKERGWEAFGEEGKKEEVEFDAARIREYMEEVQNDAETVRTNAIKIRGIFSQDVKARVAGLYGNIQALAPKIIKADEKKLKEERGQLISRATHLKSDAMHLGQRIDDEANAARLSKLEKKKLERLVEALENIVSKFNLVRNSLSSA